MAEGQRKGDRGRTRTSLGESYDHALVLKKATLHVGLSKPSLSSKPASGSQFVGVNAEDVITGDAAHSHVSLDLVLAKGNKAGDPGKDAMCTIAENIPIPIYLTLWKVARHKQKLGSYGNAHMTL